LHRRTTRRSRLRPAILAAIAVVAVLGLVAAASASRPAPISQTTGNSTMPQPAADGAGNTVVVWSYDDGVHPTRIMGRMVGEPIFTLSRPTTAASNPELAVNDAGRGVAAWRYADGSNTRIGARRIAGVSTFFLPETLSPAGEDASAPQVAINDDGDAFVVWSSNEGGSIKIRERTVFADSVVGPLKTLSATAAFGDDPAVAIAPNGDAIAVWTRSSGASSSIQARRITPAGDLGDTIPLTLGGGDVNQPQIAGNGVGDTFAAWVDSTGPVEQVEARSIRGSTLGPTRTLSNPSIDSASARIAAADERAVVVWEASVDPQNFTRRVQGRSLTAAGDRGPMLTLTTSGPGAAATEARVSIQDDGDAIAAWTQTVPPSGGGETTYRAKARAIAANDVLQDAFSVSSAESLPSQHPEVVAKAFDADVIWTGLDPGRSVVYRRSEAVGP
jgi:hypothetical protein